MKIKTKLTLGVGLLFFLIVLLVGLATRQVYKLSNDTENILVANYNSLDYSRNMLKELGKIEKEGKSFEKFDKFLKLQSQNITEIGEDEFTQNLIEDIVMYKKQNTSLLASKIRNDIFDIMKVNMDAIQRKSNIASKTAQDAILWISLTGTTCFVIAFTLLINLPSNIANPIRDLTNSIRQIADRNYQQRVHFESHNEFGDLARSFNTMAMKLQEYNESNLAKLMMEKKRVETLINNMRDPVIGLDDKNTILFVNEQALNISSLKAIEVIGKSANEVAISNDLIRSLLQHLVDNEIKSKPETLKIYADKKESYFEKQFIPIEIIPTGEKERINIGSFIILRNVTAYKELDEAKTNFIATVSHEFKTPIASMKMSLQLLENEGIGELNQEQKELVHSIYDDANRLLKTTGELLNITQVESGKTKINIEHCAVKPIVMQAIESTKSTAEQNKIKLELITEENLPEILVDKEKTVWVISNLISNAIRYSYENSSVRIEVEKDSKNIFISVIDNGLGISSQYKDKIFDKYFRVPGTVKEGTGLGLAISKEFIEAQGGKISVESELGSGSKFTVQLNIS
ncbi:sensor histidine kinase [Flavobacterium aquiphilum]|uniref:sensor histidine kinase n=1 Tax=Flavobacterium aquiphilum TaxID=3003261 RepID=UPI0024814606|nr:ATP-binding protein [Flavobacterium aquiphilum]